MARKKTKSQKIKTAKKTKNTITTNVVVSETGVVTIEAKSTKESRIKSTPYSDSQVSLIYKDLLKTAITTLVVFSILISIFIYVR